MIQIKGVFVHKIEFSASGQKAECGAGACMCKSHCVYSCPKMHIQQYQLDTIIIRHQWNLFTKKWQDKCREIQRNEDKCREVQRNAEKGREM